MNSDYGLGRLHICINPDPWWKRWGWKLALGIVLAVLFYYAFRVTPEMVAACVEHTGWSEERCKVKLS